MSCCTGLSGCCCSDCQSSAVQYVGGCVCPESSCSTTVTERVSGVFKNVNAFAMPACGANVAVEFENVIDVPIGAWLWAEGLGVLEIVSFNATTSEITVTNPCPEDDCEDQAAPGTPIVAGTAWVLTVPRCGSGVSGPSSLYPFLNSGFVAPAEGACVDIAVTNTNGLGTNKSVSIANATYRISNIASGTLITICNDGEGATPGTVIDYEDSNGNLIVPVILIDSNPCLDDPETSGVVLVCKNNIIKPLVGTEEGQVLVFGGEDESNFRTLGIPVIDCTTLISCLTLDPDLPKGTPYLIEVTSTADFVLGQLILIQGVAFTVTEIVDGTQMRVTPVVHPAAIEIYSSGTQVCGADCCTELLNYINRLVHFNSDPNGDQYLNHACQAADAAPLAAPVLLTRGGTLSVDGNTLVHTIENFSLHQALHVFYTYDFTWVVEHAGASGQYQELTMAAEIGSHADPGSVVLAPIYVMPKVLIKSANAGVDRHGWTSSFSGVIGVGLAIPVGGSLTFKGRASLEINNAFGSSTSVNVLSLAARVSTQKMNWF